MYFSSVPLIGMRSGKHRCGGTNGACASDAARWVERDARAQERAVGGSRQLELGELNSARSNDALRRLCMLEKAGAILNERSGRRAYN